MQALKAGKLKSTASDDAYDTGIGTQFSAETNIGDTDEEMMKYIEEQLKKRKGIEVDSKDGERNKYLTPEEAAVIDPISFILCNSALVFVSDSRTSCSSQRKFNEKV